MICLDGKAMAKSCLLERTIFVRHSTVTNELALSDADRQDITSDVCNGNASQPTPRPVLQTTSSQPALARSA